MTFLDSQLKSYVQFGRKNFLGSQKSLAHLNDLNNQHIDDIVLKTMCSAYNIIKIHFFQQKLKSQKNLEDDTFWNRKIFFENICQKT